MAKFKRTEKRLEVEFGEKKYFIDVTDKKLGKEIIKFANSTKDASKNEEKTIEEVRQELAGLINTILGENAYEEIKEAEFDNEELNYFELLSVGEFLLDEINNYNTKLAEINTKRIQKYNDRIK